MRHAAAGQDGRCSDHEEGCRPDDACRLVRRSRTGSVRRQHQLRWQRPDLKIVDFRGNVPTRLRKLRENEDWSGIILARAGLERLGLALKVRDSFARTIFVPAGGQGVIALQVRRDDEHAQQLGRRE